MFGVWFRVGGEVSAGGIYGIFDCLGVCCWQGTHLVEFVGQSLGDLWMGWFVGVERFPGDINLCVLIKCGVEVLAGFWG